MTTVPKRPLGVTLTSTDLPDHDAWLAALRTAIDDGLAAGEDATRRLSDRVLSRAEARRNLELAEASINALFASDPWRDRGDRESWGAEPRIASQRPARRQRIGRVVPSRAES